MPAAQPGSGRTFTCVHCHGVVLVCSYCDRGQRYCSKRCRDQARRIRQRQAGQRYQRTHKGRCAHDRRQQRYRKRQQQKEVTHQCSQEVGSGDLLAPELSVAPELNVVAVAATSKVVPRWHCHWCGRTLARVVRHGFLRHAELQNPLTQWFGGITRGQSP